jgi:PleD family two-component response regulator
VLLVSACGDPGTMEEAARRGGTDYLTKPVDGTKLRSKVSERLGA